MLVNFKKFNFFFFFMIFLIVSSSIIMNDHILLKKIMFITAVNSKSKTLNQKIINRRNRYI